MRRLKNRRKKLKGSKIFLNDVWRLKVARLVGSTHVDVKKTFTSIANLSGRLTIRSAIQPCKREDRKLDERQREEGRARERDEQRKRARGHAVIKIITTLLYHLTDPVPFRATTKERKRGKSEKWGWEKGRRTFEK